MGVNNVNKFKKYSDFDVMITPMIIKIIFWIGVAISVIFGLITIFSGLGMMFSGFGEGFIGFLTFIFGFIIIAIGILVTRIYCELMIVAFKIQESLHSIDETLKKQSN